MKNLFLIFGILTILMTTSCADSKDFIIDGKTVTIEPYGWANYETVKHDSIIYEVSMGNIVWSCLLVETIVFPVVFTGWYLYEPVAKKRTPLRTAYLTSYGEYCEGFEPMAIPLCPTPRVEESPNSYKDGYNRGFVTAQRKNQ